MGPIVLTVFVVLTTNIFSCPLDTKVVEDDRGCDVCQCCRFENGDYNVYCHSRGLTSVPQIPTDTTYLDLRENPILHLNNHSFPRLPQLASLLLGNDTHEKFALLTADSGSFHNLPTLRNLTLSVNLDNVTTFLSSAMELKNLALMCAKSTSEGNDTILFSGLRLDVLETHNCSFKLAEGVFTYDAKSTVPEKLLLYIYGDQFPSGCDLPNTDVYFFYERRTDIDLWSLIPYKARTFTKNCIGPSTKACKILGRPELTNVKSDIHIDVKSYSGTGSLWPALGTNQHASFKINEITTTLMPSFLDDVYRPPAKVSKLSLSTKDFPLYNLLGSKFMERICQATEELSLQGYLLGEIARFDFDLTSFTCSNCLLFCSQCFNYSYSLRKLNITDTRSNVLLDLGATLKANPALEELVLNTNWLTVDMRYIPFHPKLVHLELSASTYLTRIFAPSDFSSLMNLERFIVKNVQYSGRLEADFFCISGLERLTSVDFSDWSVNVVGSLDDRFTGLNSLRELRMSNNGFWKTIERLEQLLTPVAEQLEILDLSYNRISIIPDSLLNEMYNLRRLNLSGNYLTSLDGGVFRKSFHLSLLSLHDNRLETINVWYFWEMDYLREVDFSGNRLPCTCANRGVQAWIRSSRATNRVLVHYNELCAGTHTRTEFMNYSLPWIECDSHALYVSIAAPSAFLTIVVAGLITVFYYRYDIQFWWVVRRRYRINRRYRIDPEKKFHAFLSYASSEQNLAYDIFYKLENDKDIKFKIAYNHREFLAGFTIAENIIRCIDQSEKVLFLISRQFLVRDWCEFEMNFAQMRCFDEHRNVIILIFVEKFRMSELPKRLRILCRHVNYLQYPDHADRRAVQNFWHRLRLSLAEDSLLDTDLSVMNNTLENTRDEQEEENTNTTANEHTSLLREEENTSTTANEHTSLLRGVV